MNEESVSIVHDNIEVTLNSNGDTKVFNQSSETYRVFYYNPAKSYYGYVEMNLLPNHWCISNPSRWDLNKSNDDFEVIIIGKNKHITFKILRSENKILVEIDKSIEVIDYEIQNKKISFILSAYKVSKYIDSAIEGILSLKKPHIFIEILIGVDACEETLKHLTKKTYPPEVKIYFFNENSGLFIVRNTLIEKAKYNDLIFLDPDDIPCENLLTEYLSESNNYDEIFWGSYHFLDGVSIKDSSKLEYNRVPNGSCGIKRNKLLEINGFQPWRCQADDELDRRTHAIGWKRKFIDLPLFYYRIRKGSLSNNSQTKKGSIIRNTYLAIMTENYANKSWPNPDRLYTAECLRIK